MTNTCVQPIYDERILSDLHKDARGFRPGQTFCDDWKAATVAERNATWSSLIAELQAEQEREAADQRLALARFEALISKTIELGAGSRQAALRWLIEADDQHKNGDQLDVGFYLWGQGIYCPALEAEIRQAVSRAQ